MKVIHYFLMKFSNAQHIYSSYSLRTGTRWTEIHEV
jgi:hypothetical protein